MSLDPELLRSFPKVSLHDHLDGGLRPSTVLELAAAAGHPLPAADETELGRWFVDAADSGSLVRYLETFEHTVAVMQSPANLRRIAREFVEDLAADGVVYGEARWAPEQHTRSGLSPAAAIEAVRDGLADGMRACAAAGHDIEVRQLVTAMRHVPEPTTEIAELAVAYRDDGVVGFDIAGAELGFPPERFAASFALLRRENGFFTIHAGEADSMRSIWAAVQLCGAHRIGHGAAIVEDLADGAAGRLAAYVRQQQIPLEMCPSSNLQTGVAPSIAEHPIGRLHQLGFRVTVNCDNQLMSGTRLSREFGLCSEAFDWDVEDVRRLSLNAARSVFASWATRQRLVRRISDWQIQRISL